MMIAEYDKHSLFPAQQNFAWRIHKSNVGEKKSLMTGEGLVPDYKREYEWASTFFSLPTRHV